MTENHHSSFRLVYWIIGISCLIRLFFIAQSNLLVEEAYYWNYAQHLAFGYLDHPPMVAFLIRVSTTILGTNEFAVRFPTVLCWLITVFYSWRLTSLVSKPAGIYAIFLLCILPFFFLQSLVITPDSPLLACWSAALYYLYRALVLEEKTAWYTTGIWVGLGLFSKYTMVLLGPATIIYLCLLKKSRGWFLKKEPYGCALLAIVLFSPVIVWNAQHEWVSFIFQGSRRVHSVFIFSLPELLGLTILFLTPCGVYGLGRLLTKQGQTTLQLELPTLRFFQVYTLFPLLFYGLFSIGHMIKFNWIGTGLLALIPWLAAMLALCTGDAHRKYWFITGGSLIVIYGVLITAICIGRPLCLNRMVLTKFISWENVSQQLYALIQDAKKTQKKPIILLPLDRYEFNSEFRFYQAKLQHQNPNTVPVESIGRCVLGAESLMFDYWSIKEHTKDGLLLLVAFDKTFFNNPAVATQLINPSAIEQLWANTQGSSQPIKPLYYQWAQLKT